MTRWEKILMRYEEYAYLAGRLPTYIALCNADHRLSESVILTSMRGWDNNSLTYSSAAGSRDDTAWCKTVLPSQSLALTSHGGPAHERELLRVQDFPPLVLKAGCDDAGAFLQESSRRWKACWLRIVKRAWSVLIQ